MAGAEDGSINVWNFRSGRLLSTVSRPPADAPGSQWDSGSGAEVTGLAVATSTDTNGQAAPCIVATGWDRKVRAGDASTGSGVPRSDSGDQGLALKPRGWRWQPAQILIGGRRLPLWPWGGIGR